MVLDVPAGLENYDNFFQQRFNWYPAYGLPLNVHFLFTVSCSLLPHVRNYPGGVKKKKDYTDHPKRYRVKENRKNLIGYQKEDGQEVHMNDVLVTQTGLEVYPGENVSWFADSFVLFLSHCLIQCSRSGLNEKINLCSDGRILKQCL